MLSILSNVSSEGGLLLVCRWPGVVVVVGLPLWHARQSRTMLGALFVCSTLPGLQYWVPSCLLVDS